MSRTTSALCAVAATLLGAAAIAPRAVADDACPNAALRAVQRAGSLPECRAYEQVTPAAKGASEVDSTAATVQAAPAGDAIAFSTPTALPGSPTSLAFGFYRAARTAAGWRTVSIDPPQYSNGELQALAATRWISRDLTHAVEVSRRAVAPGAVEGQDNLYLHDLVADRRRLVAMTPMAGGFYGAFIYRAGTNPITGATPDLGHFVFTTSGSPLTPGASPSVSNVYEWADNGLRLVSVLPDGSVPTDDASAWAELRSGGRAVSDDGTTAAFTASGGIYVRRAGVTVLAVDGSAQTMLQTVSADGRYVFFVRNGPDPAGQPTVGLNVPYRYDVATQQIEKLADAPGVVVSLALRISDDGERFFFLSGAKLTPDAAAGAAQIYLWDHGTTRLVGPAGDDLEPKLAVTPDGRRASILTSGPLAGVVASSPACPDSPQGCAEVYAYDAQTGSLACASCAPHGPSLGHASTGVPTGVGVSADPHSVLADGTVLFDTPNALVPEDVNRQRDVYAWKDGHARLLTTGTSPRPALFRDASADGADVYVLTSGRLVAQDRDDAIDLYDIRRGGGIEAQNAPPAAQVDCTADACQDQPSGAPALLEAGTLTFAGAGDLVASPRRRPAPARLTVARATTIRGPVARLRVRVSGAGTVTVSGAAVRRTVRTARAAGTYSVTVALRPAAARRLQRLRTLRTRVLVRYRSRAGASVTRRLSVTFTQSRSQQGGH